MRQETPQQLHSDRYQIHPQAKDYTGIGFSPRGFPAIRVKNGGIGFTSSEQNPDSSRLHYRHYTVAADDDESFGFIRTPGMIDHTYRNAPYRNEPHNCARK
jgi:hypothetical protein